MDSLQESRTNWACERCGTAVSARFVRVFGTDRSVYGCTECLPSKALYAGAAARPDD